VRAIYVRQLIDERAHGFTIKTALAGQSVLN
jgi:hypothetical protein